MKNQPVATPPTTRAEAWDEGRPASEPSVDFPRRRPAVVAVTQDRRTRDLLAWELRSRYGSDYHIVICDSSVAALAGLRRLKTAGNEVAVILAAHTTGNTAGAQLLLEAHQLHPLARRGLLVPVHQTRSDRRAAIEACALGQADCFLQEPVSQPDEGFHRAVTEFLDEWWRLRGRPFQLLRVIGDEHCARCHEIRDLLRRHEVPFGFLPRRSADATSALSSLQEPVDRYPVVILVDGRVLEDRTNSQVADALGAAVRPSDGTYDVTIVGGGPAGLAAAVYAGSEGLRTLLLEREALGGQAGTSSMIRNYLGFPHGIPGAELAARAVDQALLFDAEIVYGNDAVSLHADGDLRILTLSDGTEVRSRSVIIATGVSYRRLGIPSLEALVGSGVFYGAALAEAQALTGKPVFVVGGGNSAGQAAVHLAKYAAHVTIVVRSGSLADSMSSYLINQITATPNIEVEYGARIVGGGGNGHLERLEVHDRRTDRVSVRPAAALFVLIGGQPFTDWLPLSVERDQWGYVLTGSRCGSESCDMARCGLEEGASAAGRAADRAPLHLETSLAGVFAVGDVRQGSVKRVAAATGEGASCVRLVHEYLADPEQLPAVEPGARPRDSRIPLGDVPTSLRCDAGPTERVIPALIEAVHGQAEVL